MRAKVLLLQKLIRHRGPDWSGTVVQSSAVLAHERLGVVNPASGHQPLVSPNGDVALAANGEIYNHAATRAQFKDFPFATGSDCEAILPPWFEFGLDCVKHLDGQFAFVLSDQSTGRYVAARDPMGIVPMARLTTPRAVPRTSALAWSITMAACIVLNIEVPSPVSSSRDADRMYEPDSENSSSATSASMEPIMNTRPW